MLRIRPSLIALLLLSVCSTSAAQLSGIVEIEMRQDGGQLFFDPVGVWVEPGTTIRFILVDGLHDAQAYHVDNEIGFTRIPEGAEPWDSGMLGGLLDTAGVFEVTLTVEGVYDYFCSPHQALGMVGRIVVGNPDAGPARPLDEIPFEAARAALPAVERILAEEAVYLHGGPAADRVLDAEDIVALREAIVGDVLGAWGGEESIVLEPFQAPGPWELTLGAWCFEGIGFVRVEIFDERGGAVADVTVLGEGVERIVLDTPPGAYTMEVTVSQSHIYTWELVATAAEGTLAAGSPDASQLAQDALAARVAALELEVEQLRAALTPPPPSTTQHIDGFTFQRVGVVQTSTSSYAEVVGEVIAPRTEQAVRLRATLYASDGSIIATEPFHINAVADEPRAFEVLMIGVQLTRSNVVSVRLQVE